MKMIYLPIQKEITMNMKKNKPLHMMSETEFQHTVLDGEISPDEAHYKLAAIVARISNQFDMKAIMAGLENSTNSQDKK